MSEKPWKIDNKNLTITLDSRKFKHTYYAPNEEIFAAKLAKLETPAKLVKLHLGCGNEHLDGYINIDVQPSKFTDEVSDCTKLSNYADNSVDEIVSYHMIEHIAALQQKVVLEEWKRVLKPKGKLVLECPDAWQVFKTFVETTDHERYVTWNQGPALIYHIYGNQGDEFEFHKFCYTTSLIKTMLESLGFQNVYFGESHKDYRVPCIHVECTKP